jgi:UTP-glucose-1-phosphate uridylyltransferase
MREVTGGRPKELLPVAGRPAAAHALTEAALAGARTAIVVIRRGKEILAEELPRHAPEGLELVFEYQPEQLGECDALAAARRRVGDEPVGVIYPDNIPKVSGALAETVETTRRTGLDSVALVRVDPETARGLGNSGRVDTDRSDHGEYLITEFHDKGPGAFVPRFPNDLRACGVYCALPRYFDYIEKARTALEPGRELTDGMVRRMMLADGVEFAGTPVQGPVFDVGFPEGYRLCRKLMGA